MKKVFLPQLCKTYWKHQYSCGWIFKKNLNVYLKRKPWRVSIRLMFNTQFQSKVNGGASATIAAALQHWLVLSCQRKSLDFFWFNCFNERARDGRRRQRGCLTHKKKKKAGREMGGRASEWSDSSSVWLRWLMETDGRSPERSQTSGAALLPRPLAFNPLRVCMRDAQISWGLPEEVNTSTDTEPWREKNCLTTHNVELQEGG